MGGVAKFSVGASGTGLTFQWYSASGPLSDGSKYSGTTSDTLQIASVDNDDVAAGPYHVVVNGGCGPPITSDPANIVILEPPLITSWHSVLTHGSDGPLAIALGSRGDRERFERPDARAQAGRHPEDHR